MKRICKRLKVWWQDLTRPLAIQYSLDGSLFYVDGGERPRIWMTLEAKSGHAPASEKDTAANAPFGPTVVELTDTRDGAVYWRKIYPFAMWSVCGGGMRVKFKRSHQSLSLEMAKDYAASSAWNRL